MEQLKTGRKTERNGTGWNGMEMEHFFNAYCILYVQFTAKGANVTGHAPHANKTGSLKLEGQSAFCNNGKSRN